METSEQVPYTSINNLTEVSHGCCHILCTLYHLISSGRTVLYDSTINNTNLQGDLTFELREYPSVKWVCTEGQYDMAAEVREVNFI